jgi:microcystin-dependent protein
MSEPFMGTVMIWAPNFAPRGWAFCQGQLIAISTNSALFSLLGVVYGGNGQTTFGLPNLAGRVPVGQGQSPGTSSYTLGQTAGTEQVTLTTAQMPMHNHGATLSGATGSVTVQATTNPGASTSPSTTNNMLGTTNEESFINVNLYAPATTDPTKLVNLAGGSVSNMTGTVAVAPNGSSLPFPVMQPYQVLNYVIAARPPLAGAGPAPADGRNPLPGHGSRFAPPGEQSASVTGTKRGQKIISLIITGHIGNAS